MSETGFWSTGWSLVCVAVAGLVLPATTWADPPSHAPAHGWRKKHDPDYVGYTGKKWPKDYGVIEGRCNRAAIGAVLGGAVGGAVGSTIGKGDGKTVAIIVGTVLGAAIGAKIGKDVDQADRGCIGHALELGGDKHGVTWLNEETGVRYLVTPVRGFERDGQQCREFTTQTTYKNKVAEEKGKACRVGDGEWRMS